MIDLLQVFPVRYDEEADGDFGPYDGLMNISSEAADFYNQLFGMALVAGEGSPLGEDESAFDEQIDSVALGLPLPENPNLSPGAAFLVEDLDQAKKTLAAQKIPIIYEGSPSTLRVAFIADPDENPIVIFEMLN